jgi:hypothetical protein
MARDIRRFKDCGRMGTQRKLCASSRQGIGSKPKRDQSVQDGIRVRSLSFRTASFGVLTPRCNHSRTFVTVNVCFTELRTSTSSWVNPPGSSSCLRNAHNPKTDASYKPSASISTEWRTPSKSTKDTIQAAMRRSLAFSLIFTNRTMCHLWHRSFVPADLLSRKI